MKKNFSRGLALVLVLVMALSLAACGEQSSPEETAAQEYVYKAQFTPMDLVTRGVLEVMAYTPEGAYASCNEVVDRVIPEGADIADMSEEDLTRFDVYSTNIYFLKNDGSAQKLPAYKAMEGKEDTGEYKDYYSQSYPNSITPTEDGKLLAVEYVYTGWYDGPEGKTYADEDYYDYFKSFQDVYIRTLDSTGAELSVVSLDLGSDQYFHPCAATDGDGNLLGSLDNYLAAYDSQGQQVYTIDCGGYVQSVVKLADGRLFAAIYGDNGMALSELDWAGRKLGKSFALPNDAYTPIAGGGDYDLYYTSGTNLYGYDLETGTAQKLFNWINCDINSDDLGSIYIAQDGSVTAYVSEGDYPENVYANQRLTVTKVPYDPSQEKETLKLACLSLDYNVQNAVIKFNRSSDSARIEIVDYSEYDTGEEGQSGSQKLLTEMMAGQVADIVALDGLPYRRIASKGLLEDLYPYLDADTELKREDFFPNVMDALDVDGKLYGLCPAFTVGTVLGAKSVVGEGPSWTYDEFDAALDSMPEGCEPFEHGVSRDDILRACVSLDMAEYINWSTGQCSFDSQQFIDLLEFAARFPETHTDERPEESTQERIASGAQMLIATSIYSLDDILYDSSYFSGQEVCYIGFPTLSGSGNVLNISGGFAMSSGCKDKDAAWQFLRSFMTEKYQKDNVWSLPTNQAAYKDKVAQVMKTSYITDANGQYVLDENGEKIKEPRYTMSVDDGPVVNVYAMSKEQADEVSAVVMATTKAYDYDESIISIVQEQAKAFFAGQKTAQEVARLVQGKVNIYVNEQG